MNPRVNGVHSMPIRPWFSLVLVVLAAMAGFAEGVSSMQTTTVFQASEDGYHTYRIPAIVRAHNNMLLAFCEGRVHGRGDASDIDLVLKRSGDGGRTWSALQVIVDDGGHTCGNPAPVVLTPSGEVLLVFTKNDENTDEGAILRGDGPPRTVWVTRSSDHGVTWAEPREISNQARRDDWRWYATGPCHAIQLPSSRIVVPCNHSLSPDFVTWFSHVIYSDDDGESWTIGGIAGDRTNESTVAALPDGRLYMNMRNYRNTHRRASAWSEDQGITWGTLEEAGDLTEPVCQASCLAPKGSNRLYFSNPASTTREKLTIHVSADGGKSWEVHAVLHEGPAAYSDLVSLGDQGLGCLFECGSEHPYERITFTRFATN